MISVCLASYNGSKYIVQQLQSILHQLNEDDEVIVSDDNSTDSTIALVRSINDARIKIIENNLLPGVIGNFENALRNVKHNIIFLSDQDDIWQSNKVRVMLEALKYADLVVSDCFFIDDMNAITDSSFFELYKSGDGVFKNFIKNTYLGNCIAFNRNVLDVSLPFPRQLYEASKYQIYHDVWIGMLADSLYTVKFLPQKLSFFRRHSDNASPTNSSAISSNTLLDKFKGRRLLFIGLTTRFIDILKKRYFLYENPSI
jgi:glycosyltransferase involved in cell wall biosynthesis